MTASDRPLRPGPRADAARRRARRRRDVRRRRGVAALVLLFAVVAVVIAQSVGGSAQPRPVARTPITSRTPAATTQHHASRHPRTTTTPAAPSPGSLPQTTAVPSGTTAQFHSLMATLWSGIVDDSVARALPAFFPKRAYEQLKAIPDAGSDWTGRLVRDFGLDITAAHSLLGRGAVSDRLVSVNVTASYSHWIRPGVCYNSIGYYEMPNARVVYSQAGQIHSLGIASMISWRGVWYVVHFGSILRPSIGGVVDDPATGPGTSAYSGTC
jgi:hypothetical protein